MGDRTKIEKRRIETKGLLAYGIVASAAAYPTSYILGVLYGALFGADITWLQAILIAKLAVLLPATAIYWYRTRHTKIQSRTQELLSVVAVAVAEWWIAIIGIVFYLWMVSKGQWRPADRAV